MASDNNIKNFTAVDIEKYHKGLLSAKEMHDLEKAALDDPFLADALEGYAVAGVNAEAEINELKKRLGQRIDGAKIIPLNTTGKNNYRMLKIAAMLLFVAAAAFSVYQFGFNKKADSIAQSEPVKTEKNNIADSIDDGDIAVTPPVSTDKIVSKPAAGSDKSTGTINNNDGIATNDATISSTPAAAPIVAKDNEATRAGGKAPEKKVVANNETFAKEDVKQEAIGALAKNKAAEKQSDDEKINRSVTANRKAEEQHYRNQTSNIFRGRVTDQNNVGVPFANVTNLEENTGTYTDARGYFNLTYPDSVLNVQVRSIGFENNNVQLRNAAPSNQVVLQDDRAGLSEVVISNQKPNLLARSNNNTMQLEEPEPTDGWGYYDNYLVNNIQLPDEYKSKPIHSGEVQVSFEVNKNGEPTNFKIVKSLCSKCDKEAIRLIKEGPKWIRKAKNGRTTVTIPF